MDNNEIARLLKEILKWLKLQSIEMIKKKVEEEKLFQQEQHILVYYHSDGNKSSRDIEEITRVCYKTVQALWRKWKNAGIAEGTDKYKGGRCERLFELSELGLEFQDIEV